MLEKRWGPTVCFGIMLCAVIPAAQAQVTSNVLRRVLMIQADKNSGSSFTLEVDGRQYLITAKHVVASLKSEDTIQIRKGDEWSSVKVKVLRCDDPIDIAVLVPASQLTVSFRLEPITNNVFFGQDAYFVGFPYGLSMDAKEANGLYPIAFMKKGIFSAMVPEGSATVIFLDGHNNPGFSGGPIVYRDLNQSGPPIFHVAGVVSGYRHEFVPTVVAEEVKPGDDLKQEEPWRIVKLADGRTIRLKDTDQLARLNTGIVKGYHIKHAVELIQKHPIGPTVSDKVGE
jgi:hypothetical protein